MKESNIVHEAGSFWVARERASYTVYKSGITHSVSDSAYSLDDDGLSIAITRCDYLAKREVSKAEVKQ
jgi:hypothetical protein